MDAQEQKELTDMAVGWIAHTCNSYGVIEDCGDPECEASRADAAELLKWLQARVKV